MVAPVQGIPDGDQLVWRQLGGEVEPRLRSGGDGKGARQRAVSALERPNVEAQAGPSWAVDARTHAEGQWPAGADRRTEQSSGGPVRRQRVLGQHVERGPDGDLERELHAA